MHMFVWLHLFVYYHYIERRQYPSCLLVDNSKRYCLKASLKTIWSIFAFLFTSPSITSLRITKDMVGVLCKLFTLMPAPFGVSMDLYRDLRLSFTLKMASLIERTTMGIKLLIIINMSPSSSSFNPTSTSQPIEVVLYSGNHFYNMFKTWAMWRVVGMLPPDNHFTMLGLKHKISLMPNLSFSPFLPP